MPLAPAPNGDRLDPRRSQTCLSLVVVFISIAAGRKWWKTAQQLFPLHASAAIYCGPGSELLQLSDAQIDARFENGRIERHACSLRRRRHRVTLAGTSR